MNRGRTPVHACASARTGQNVNGGTSPVHALTSVLAKVGIEGVESNLATAVRTCVVLVMAWAIVAGKGKLGQAARVDRGELGFLAASGLATGASWLLYYYAIAAGQVSVVSRSTSSRLWFRSFSPASPSRRGSHGAASWDSSSS